MRLKDADPEVRRRLDKFEEDYSKEFDRRYEEHKAKEREADKELHDFLITY